MSYIQSNLRDKPHWVYRIYDKTNSLLYIGCTSKWPVRRIMALRGESPAIMRAPLHHWTADLYPTGLLAHAAEGRAIDSHRPPHNHQSSVTTDRMFIPVVRPTKHASGLVPPKGRWTRP